MAASGRGCEPECRSPVCAGARVSGARGLLESYGAELDMHVTLIRPPKITTGPGGVFAHASGASL